MKDKLNEVLKNLLIIQKHDDVPLYANEAISIVKELLSELDSPEMVEKVTEAVAEKAMQTDGDKISFLAFNRYLAKAAINIIKGE